MSYQFEGYVFKFADNINTDYIISSRRKRDTLDLNVLKHYIMEDIRPGFFNELKEANIIVAGENFGCGSAMEVATKVVTANNFGAVIAKSFSRSYFRNCINNGLLAVQMNTDTIQEGDSLRVTMEGDKILVDDLTTGEHFVAEGYSPELRSMILAGGVMNDLDSFMK